VGDSSKEITFALVVAAVALRGARGVLESAWLPMSPPVWTTLTTGKNPGGHGVFGFGVLRPGTYDIDTVNSRYARVPRVWDMINAHGLSAGVFNVPVTYPPQPLNGYLVGDSSRPTSAAPSPIPSRWGRRSTAWPAATGCGPRRCTAPPASCRT